MTESQYYNSISLLGMLSTDHFNRQLNKLNMIKQEYRGLFRFKKLRLIHCSFLKLLKQKRFNTPVVLYYFHKFINYYIALQIEKTTTLKYLSDNSLSIELSTIHTILNSNSFSYSLLFVFVTVTDDFVGVDFSDVPI